MSTKAAHIPTPWRLVIEGDGEDEMIIRTVLGPCQGRTQTPRHLNEICFFNTGSFCDETEAANAEFAITAVNHHQELLTRLQLMIDTFDDNFPEGGPAWVAIDEAKKTLKKVKQ